MKLLMSAILKVMEEVNGVAKNMTVGKGDNAYQGVSDRDVKEKIRESMIKNKLVILPIGVSPRIKIDRWDEVDPYSKSTPKDMKSKQSVFTEVDTKYMLVHESGESIELAGYGQGVDTQDKGAGKATTYALKNTLLNMFLVPTGVDTDDTHSNDLPVPPKQSLKTEDNRPWLNDKDFDSKIVDWCFAFTTKQQFIDYANEVKQTYRLSKVMQEKLKSRFEDAISDFA